MRWPVAIFLCFLFGQVASAQSSLDISQKSWTPLPDGLRTQLIAATGIEAGLGLRPDYLTIQAQPLGWSEGSHLIRVLGGWEPRSLILYFVMRADGGLIHLDGSFAAIDALNRAVPPLITPETVADYVWFTGFFVRSGDDPFLVVETPDDRYVPALGAESAGHLRRLDCIKDAAGGGYSCEGTVYHAETLYTASFAVSSKGFVDMPASRPLAADLSPVNAPIDPRGYPGFVPLP